MSEHQHKYIPTTSESKCEICGFFKSKIEKMEGEDMKKEIQQTLINFIIERFDTLEETGADFTFAKRVVLRLAKEIGLFDVKI